ncbi:MAG: hypothetical protein AB9Q20_04690 [Candidatus Reddybacter sp.]
MLEDTKQGGSFYRIKDRNLKLPANIHATASVNHVLQENKKPLSISDCSIKKVALGLSFIKRILRVGLTEALARCLGLSIFLISVFVTVLTASVYLYSALKAD